MSNINISDILNNVESNEKVSLYLKKLALEHVPMEQNEELKRCFETDDIGLFYDLLTEYVPDLETRLYDYMESLTENRTNDV